MRIGKFLVCIWFMLGMLGNVGAQNRSIPKFALTFDFNSVFSNEDILGPRLQVYSNNNYFGKNRERKSRLNGNRAAYTYGLGLGSYKVSSFKKKAGSEDDLYFAFASFTMCYQNQSIFEPFAGVHPGMTWGHKSGFVVNPVAGINISAFRMRRNWNSLLVQTYGQVRLEYNTILSTTFLGCGFILQII